MFFTSDIKNVVKSDISFLHQFDLSASSWQEMHFFQFYKWDLSTISRRLAKLYYPRVHICQHHYKCVNRMSNTTTVP